MSFSMENSFLLKKDSTESNQFSSSKSQVVRTGVNNFMNVISRIILHILPRFTLTQKITQARVPLLRFDCDFSYLINCDLSMTCTEVSFHMTKLYWTYSQLDARVAPLVFLMKDWAKLNGLSLPKRPTNSLTSYQITTLVLYFLIKLNNPVLIPIDKFVFVERINNNGVYCIENLFKTEIVSDAVLLRTKFALSNDMRLDDLAREFFVFYSNFEFDKHVVSLSTQSYATRMHKDERLFIENPFTLENAARNVSKQFMVDFKESCKRFAVLMNNPARKLSLDDFFRACHNNKKNFLNKNTIADEMNEIK